MNLYTLIGFHILEFIFCMFDTWIYNDYGNILISLLINTFRPFKLHLDKIVRKLYQILTYYLSEDFQSH